MNQLTPDNLKEVTSQWKVYKVNETQNHKDDCPELLYVYGASQWLSIAKRPEIGVSLPSITASKQQNWQLGLVEVCKQINRNLIRVVIYAEVLFVFFSIHSF